MTLSDLEADFVEVAPSQLGPMQARFRLIMETALVGQVEAESQLALLREAGQWRVAWSPQAILIGLEEGYRVRLSVHASPRGNIYARDGTALALQEKVFTVGVVPGWITDEDVLLDTLSAVLDMSRAAIREKYASAPRQDWFMPVADLSMEESTQYRETLSNLSGVSLREKPVRSYPQGPVGAHVVGYTGQISAEELTELAPLGYRADDVIGRAGGEAWWHTGHRRREGTDRLRTQKTSPSDKS
jgi:penicillin-binding protein